MLRGARLSWHSLRASSRIVSATPDGRTLRVKWDDGVSAVFPVVWLRDCSPDPLTYTLSPTMKARNLFMRTFDVEVEMEHFAIEDSGGHLSILWPGGVRSSLSSDWLRFRNPSDDSARSHRRLVYLFPESTWDSARIEKRLKRFPFSAVIQDDKSLHDFLEAVCLDGIALLKGGPASTIAVDEIANRIAFIHRTHFGKIFEVATKENASNKAYAESSELPFHTDFPSLSDPPQLQMLHMVQPAEKGGSSLFVDGFHIAELLRREQPKLFECLVEMDAEFIEEGSDSHDLEDGREDTFHYSMTARHPVIKLDARGEKVVRIQFGNAMRSWFYDCDDPEKIQTFYRAMKTFTNYCYDHRNMLELRLEAGDTVLWANTRLLHTRTEYSDSPALRRRLFGCYFSWDFLKSRVRLIRRDLNLPQHQPSA